jgi:hypothetical protein
MCIPYVRLVPSIAYINLFDVGKSLGSFRLTAMIRHFFLLRLMSLGILEACNSIVWLDVALLPR